MGHGWAHAWLPGQPSSLAGPLQIRTGSNTQGRDVPMALLLLWSQGQSINTTESCKSSLTTVKMHLVVQTTIRCSAARLQILQHIDQSKVELQGED